MKRIRHVDTTPQRRPISRIFDEHVFLTVEVESQESGSPPLYWQVVDPKRNLIEIGVDRTYGELLSFVLTFYRGDLDRMDPGQLPKPSRRQFGIPRFDLQMWKDPTDLYDVGSEIEEMPGRCRLQLSNGTLRVEIFPETIAYLVDISDQLAIEFNEKGELCSILVGNLTNRETRTIEQYVSLHARKLKR